MGRPTQPIAERFWPKVERGDGCWNWTAAVHRNGYGKFNIDGQTHLAHRVAWMLVHGPIPEGVQILHHCDNRRCCRDDHLFEGDDQANARDMWAKGRGRSGKGTPRLGARGDLHWKRRMPQRVPRGADCSWSKLTEKQVRAIRRRYATGRITQRELADKYGVHVMVINSVILGRSWKHVR